MKKSYFNESACLPVNAALELMPGEDIMRRIVRFCFWPLVIFLLLFPAGIESFRRQLAPAAQFVVHTGAAHSSVPFAIRQTGVWSSVRHVSDDGAKITIGISQGDFRFPETWFQQWDAREQVETTPAHWKEDDWRSLLLRPLFSKPRFADLWDHPSGFEFLMDQAAWAALRRRLAQARTKAIEELRKTNRNAEAGDPTSIFPKTFSFSSDGKYFAYVARHGLPLYDDPDQKPDGTLIEDIKTGEQIAFLPGVTDEVEVSPGGRTAMSFNPAANLSEKSQPQFTLWDLKSSKRRAELLLPDDGDKWFKFFRLMSIRYSTDGRYVFVSILANDFSVHLCWWDAARGRLINRLRNVGETVLIDNDRVLVTHPSPSNRSHGVSESYLLRFWDVATGEQIKEWNLDAPSDGQGLIERLRGSASDRLLAGQYSPDYGRGRGVFLRVGDRAMELFSGGIPPEHNQVVIWDVDEERERTRVPGQSAVLSRNGQWLASMDTQGVVRVWRLPARPPWGRIVGYSMGVAFFGTLIPLLFARLIGRWFRSNLIRRGSQRVMWIIGNPKRMIWTAAIIGGFVVLIGGLIWDASERRRARESMEAAFESIEDGMTEEQVATLVGISPVEGPVTPMTCRCKGGGKTGIPTTLRKWIRRGTILDVYFGEDGKVKAWYISDPLEPVEQAAGWIGI